MNSSGKKLIDVLKNAPLEGENAHAIYSPPYRPILSEEEIYAKKPKLAAVNIMLYNKDGKWFFPLMQRTTHEKDKHSGQISLPGGKVEDHDKNYEDTAKRETAEEIGIEVPYIRIIRPLSPIYILPSNFYVFPFLSFTKKNPSFELESNEVRHLIEYPIEELLNLPDNPKTMILPKSRGIEVPVIEHDNQIIWGATSMIMNEMSHLVKNL